MSLQDEKIIHDAVAGWKDAWNRHDMSAMAKLFAEDADFVNVWGLHWKGRARIEKEHADRHRAQFKDTTWITREVKVQFLRPDLALVHVAWGMEPPREGLFTWVMLKEQGRWLIRAAHNTNVAPLK